VLYGPRNDGIHPGRGSVNVNRKSQSLRPGLLALLALCLGALDAPAYAQAPPVTLAWDGNPEPSVAGYIVYVGNASGSYGEQYDVGDQTSFAYTRVSAGRPYYFAVAAYTPGREVGERSEEIFFLSGAATGLAPSVPVRVASQLTASSPDNRRARCASASDTGCYSVERLVSLAGDASALTPTGDGRLLFVEDGRHVRVIAADTLMPDPALTAESGTRLAGLVLDPAFDRNRFVYVGEVETRADGSRELNIVRYRDVASSLAEGAAIIAGLPLPARGDAPFTIDAARRLYVAVPDGPDGSRMGSPYGGMVLRFESDGSVSRDSRGGSPVLAHGYAQPVSLVWSAARNELWLAGFDADWDGALARLPLGGDVAEWPRTPTVANLDAGSSIVSLFSASRPGRDRATPGASGDLVLVDEDEGLLRIDADALRVVPTAPLSAVDLGGEPTFAALDGSDLYLVMTPPAVALSPSSQIVRVRQH